MAHVETGELVVPVKVLRSNPKLRAGIMNAIANEGVDPQRFVVGGRGSYNPSTGYQEFGFLSSIVKTVKKIAPIAMTVAAPVVGPSLFAGTAAAGWSAATWGAIGSGLGTLVAGGSISDALKAGAFTYGAGWASDKFMDTKFTSSNQWAPKTAAAVPATQATAPQSVMQAPQAPAAAITPQTSQVGGGFSASELMKPQAAPVGIDTLAASQPISAQAAPAVAPTSIAQAAATSAPAQVAFFDDPLKWASQNKGLAALGGLTVAGGLGGFEQPQVPRPEGYTREGQEYGDKPYETRGGQLMAGIGTTGAGAPTQPIQVGAAQAPVAPAMPVYGSPVPVSTAQTAYEQMIAPWPLAPSYAQLNVANGGYIDGPGTETSDSIPANLSNGEFVMTAKAVRGAGRGSLREGARRMYAMMDELERRAR